MRILRIFSLGLAFVGFYMPAAAGTLADYTAKPGQYKIENGVRVFRIQSTASQRRQDPTYQMRQRQTLKQAKKKAFERGYDAGFTAGYDKASKKPQTRRNRYNYGRRYSTSGYNPRYNGFRSNISYGRPAYLARSKK